MRKVRSYVVRQSHFGGEWVSESPTGISVWHHTKESAVSHALKRSFKVIYAPRLKVVGSK